MKFSLLLSLVMTVSVSANPFAPAQSENSAKAEFMSRLLAKATPLRHLADNNNNNNNNNNQNNVDLTAYSVVFKKCQFVKTYSDNLAYSGSSTVLATERFVIFRLCPSGSYCAACSSNYGEYLVDLYDYLYAAVTYQSAVQTANCTTCTNDCAAYATDDKVANNQEAVAADDGQVGNGGRFLSSSSNNAAAKACKSCLDQCKFIANYQSEGYYDASDFIQCTKIYDDGTTILYAGPMCANSGSKIKIGVFTDDTCYNLDTTKSPDDYLKSNDGSPMQLSYHLLKETYTTSCVSCAYDNNGATETSQFCTTLYQKSAKCQDPSGISADAVQTSDESSVCSYISSLSAGTYSETGEINISGASSVIHGGAKTSGGQKFALTFFILGTVGLAAYAAMLHSKLTKGGKADLTNSDGALA